MWIKNTEKDVCSRVKENMRLKKKNSLVRCYGMQQLQTNKKDRLTLQKLNKEMGTIRDIWTPIQIPKLI